jgi:hypothetical protein
MKKSKKRPTARSKAGKKAANPRGRTLSSEFMEELEAALGELRRLSLELVYTRRELVAEESSARGVEASLRRELETLRTELKTARAESEIALANARRIEIRLEMAAEAEARAREAQREAEHASDRARDELLWLRREVDRLGGRPDATLPGLGPLPRGDE